MATDIILDDANGTQVTVQATFTKLNGTDLIVDAPERRKKDGMRRALVHDPNDGLTVNWNNDYPGGLTLKGVVELEPLGADAGIGRLPGIVPVLHVKGGISFDVPGIRGVPGGAATVTVSLGDEIANLKSQISALEARIAKLETK